MAHIDDNNMTEIIIQASHEAYEAYERWEQTYGREVACALFLDLYRRRVAERKKAQ